MTQAPPMRDPTPWQRARRACAGMAVVLGAACGTAPPAPAPVAPAPTMLLPSPPATGDVEGDILGRSDRLVIYRPGPGETMRAVARRWLGSEDREWIIAEANPGHRANSADPLVVPLTALNPTGARPGRLQTVPILCYHRIGNGGGRLTVSPTNFALQMEWLARNGYHVIRLAQLIAFLEGREPLPQRSVVITIDDGYESAHRHALPLLRKHGFAATLFIYTDFIGADDALSWQQLRELVDSGLIDIGAHSKTHRDLVEHSDGLSDGDYRRDLDTEVRTPRDLLERRLGVAVRHFAYPYGSANGMVMDSLARHGYQLAVTVNPGGNAFYAQPLFLRRSMIFGNHDLTAFASKLQVGRNVATP
jgi:peptidoglycan/xylan/chitin deacetylase (PgdA/CDA1 family)